MQGMREGDTMNLDEFKRKWKLTCQEEVDIWEKTESHDLDFAISYKDVARVNYQQLLDDLKELIE